MRTGEHFSRPQLRSPALEGHIYQNPTLLRCWSRYGVPRGQKAGSVPAESGDPRRSPQAGCPVPSCLSPSLPGGLGVPNGTR